MKSSWKRIYSQLLAKGHLYSCEKSIKLWNKQIEEDVDIKNELHSKISKRNERLLQQDAKDNVSKSKFTREKTKEDYKEICNRWIQRFVGEYLQFSYDQQEKYLFILDSSKISQRISPDIQGDMTKALMFSGENLLEYKIKIDTHKKQSVQKIEEEEKDKATKVFERDVTKLMEGYKYYGKDIDVNEWFKTFCSAISFEESIGNSFYSLHLLILDKLTDYDEKRITERFLKALGDLKYMGYISESGRGTYKLKKFNKKLEHICIYLREIILERIFLRYKQ